MAHANNKSHDHIDVFNPDVKTLRDSYQDFLFKIKQFDAGNGYQNFNEFISDEAIDYADDGNGVTYVVWNILKDKKFAVNQKYQNIFFEYGDEDLPVSVWVLRSIIDYIENLSKTYQKLIKNDCWCKSSFFACCSRCS